MGVAGETLVQALLLFGGRERERGQRVRNDSHLMKNRVFLVSFPYEFERFTSTYIDRFRFTKHQSASFRLLRDTLIVGHIIEVQSVLLPVIFRLRIARRFALIGKEKTERVRLDLECTDKLSVIISTCTRPRPGSNQLSPTSRENGLSDLSDD